MLGKSENQFFGLESEMPFSASPGSMFIAIDTRNVFLYDKSNLPKLIYSSNKNGFIDYNNTIGPVVVNENEWYTLPNNGAGAFTNKKYSPYGINELMDVNNGTLDLKNLDLGDSVLIRNDFTINPNTNNALVRFRYQLGSGSGVYTLETTLGRLDDGSGKEYRFSLKPDLIYMGDTNTKNNPIFIQVNVSSNCIINNAGSVIQVIKK